MRTHVFLTVVITLNAGLALATETALPPVPLVKSTLKAATYKPTLVQAPSTERIIFDDLGKQYCLGKPLCVEHCAKPDQGCEAKSV